MRVRKKLLMFGAPRIEQEEIAEVVKTLRSGWLGTGPKVDKFQAAFREYVGTKYAVALNSCTAALHLAMIAAGIKKGDEVVTSPLTFCATANAIIHAGGKPVFADVERDTMNIDPAKIEKAITRKTKAVIPVHLAGRPCRMDPIMKIARRRRLVVIEDAAHCIEGRYKGRNVGAIGDAGCFSFYVTKNIVTGEGGMVTTNRKDWADKIKIYGLHGMSQHAWLRYSDRGYKRYHVEYAGFKYNMTDIQASIGIHQLKRIHEYYKRRKAIWEMYDDAFSKLPVLLPAPEERNTVHARHLYVLLIDGNRPRRDEVQRRLFRLKVGTGVHYEALHLHPYYARRFGCKRGDYPNAEFISDRTLSIPLSAKLTDDDARYVIQAVKKSLER